MASDVLSASVLFGVAAADATINIGNGGTAAVSNANVTIQAGQSVQWVFFSLSYYLYQQPSLNNCTASTPSEFGGNLLISAGNEGYTHVFPRVGEYFWYVERLTRSECQNGGQGSIRVIERLPSTSSVVRTGTGFVPGTAATTTSAGITQIVITGAPNVPTGPSVPYVTFGGAVSGSAVNFLGVFVAFLVVVCLGGVWA
ncbi:hypothetical protein HDU67_010405 [Dinochytrium kinnereticum]|nr:hypothetical protein HDU67_010405 [Dinochytrium kinnereticum]